MNSISDAPTSNHDHSYSSLGRFENSAIAVAGIDNLKVEEFKNGAWRQLNDFPFAEGKLYDYSMVTLNEALYLFGTFFMIYQIIQLNLFRGF